MPDTRAVDEDDGWGKPFAFGLDREPEPRAVVAISEDRQWLVVLTARGRWRVWELNEWGDCLRQKTIKDAGQDANDVLAKFLEGRE